MPIRLGLRATPRAVEGLGIGAWKLEITMRILLGLRSDAFAVFGGDVQYALEIKKALEAAGHKVVTTDEVKPDVGGVDVVNLINVVNVAETWEKINYFKERGVPVVLTPEYYNLDRFFLHTHWKANVARLVLGEHSALKLFRLKKHRSRAWRILTKLINAADHVVAKSERERRQLILDFKLPKRKISVVANGVDPAFGRRAKPHRFTQRYGVKDFLLTVGRVEPIKNQLSLLKATRGLDVPFVFVGSGYTASDSYLLECKREARGRRVLFIDRLSHGSLPDAFAAARAHIAPSYNETTSLVSLEAAMAGCPIVITKESPHKEYFGDSVVTCDPYDIKSIRLAVLKVLEHSKRVERLRGRLTRSFSWPTITRQLAAVYRRIA